MVYHDKSGLRLSWNGNEAAVDGGSTVGLAERVCVHIYVED